MYARPDDSTDSARLTFVSPTGNKLKSLKEVKRFLEDTANAPRIPVKGGLIEAEMEDEHEKRLEWVQGTITKVLPRNGGFQVSFKVENAEEKGTWEETYKVGQLLRLSTVSFADDAHVYVCQDTCLLCSSKVASLYTYLFIDVDDLAVLRVDGTRCQRKGPSGDGRNSRLTSSRRVRRRR